MWIAVMMIAVIVLILFFWMVDKKYVKCKYCKHVFERDESKSVEYIYEGEHRKSQECPKCGKYTEI